MASSGDAGVKGNDAQCYDGDEGAEYVPTFPASAPYVTSVGGTQEGRATGVDGTTGETAWLYSGGGFSDYFDAPSWQTSAISAYFSNNDISFPDESRFSRSGRAYPDLSAQSVNYVVVIDGEYYGVSGTSASTPTVAGMISLINYGRSKAGKSSLGFINPVLYSLYAGKDSDYYFNDIVEGYNIGCSEDDDVGFETSNGWDPVTGLGTPKFSRLFAALSEA